MYKKNLLNCGAFSLAQKPHNIYVEMYIALRLNMFPLLTEKWMYFISSYSLVFGCSALSSLKQIGFSFNKIMRSKVICLKG